MPSFDPLSFSMALVAILLGSLGDFVAYLLDLPEWRLPRVYNRAEYEPEEFCVYLIRWVMDGYDTTFLFFGLLGTLVYCAIKFWQYCQREPVDAAISLSHEELDALMGSYLEKIPGDAGGRVEGMGSVARETIAALQIRAKDSETRCNDAQDTIADLRDTNNTLRNHETELVARLYAQRQAFSAIKSANTALQSQNSALKMKLGAEQEDKQREVEKSSNAAAKMDAQMKHLSAEAATWKQRAEKAEQALCEKDNAIRTADQEQKQLESRLQFATERIEKLEEEAEERKSEREALQDRAETAESNEHFSKKKLESSESQRQHLQSELDTTRKEFSQIRKGFNKAAKDVSTLKCLIGFSPTSDLPLVNSSRTSTI